MAIMIVSSYLPYPLINGGNIRLYNLLKHLSKNHEITLICEKRSFQTEEDVEEVRKFCKKVETVARKKQWTLSNIIKTGFSFMPFLLTGHTNADMKQKILYELKNNNFDLIHVETFYVFQNLPKVFIPTVLVDHNIEYLVYERYTKSSPFFLKPLLYLDVLKLKFWEKYYWRKADKLIAVSGREKNIMEEESGRRDVEVIPNGVAIEKFQVQNPESKIEKEEKRILFIGDFKWIENIDSIKWIIKEIWPIIKFKILNLKFKIVLWVVGRKIPNSIKSLANDQNILFDENTPMDTFLIYKQSDVLLSPIRVGGGTSFKILEAMASGVAVVTNFLGIEGIGARNGEQVLIGESSEELADGVVKLLNDQNFYNNIAQNARRFIEEKYAWKIISKKLEQVYYDTVQYHSSKTL